MTQYWIAQSVGVLAFLVGITMFFNRNDQKFKIQLSAYSAVIGLHFFLMGANAAGASALLNSARTLISLKTHNILVMFVFISLTLLFGLSGMNHPMELLPIAGTVASTWALFRTSGVTTRCVIWCSTACWVAHNIWLGSIGGSLIEGSFLLMNGFNIIRFWRMQQRGIDPFSVEKKA
ncbi:MULTISPECIES: YgjV family protein [Pectobacterium]|uniref:YgjV family protein n=1 Tax=Pectobacterium aquaticum TaxID=2204145 RepID=A0AA93AJT8_9GAMM|nr:MULTISPECIES: YgjV family protein [Pectobacterium]MBN3194754.1 YgjV family protein [Pectobacterium versatile]RRN94529.1 YgjV family protein [Pectobacterium aquaticum]RRO01835.1 YgjV family protein [Pectobacterium aquaticum]RRO11495.1 YgjV family protein [Pectobacterium aquaticum]RRO15998.1 YgjV family protein [Pectobacterium aquaticum]